MEEDSKIIRKKNGISSGFSTQIPAKFSWHVNITIIDLSASNIKTLDKETRFPENLLELNLAHNKFLEVPSVVLKLEKLKNLDISHNEIVYFDDTPNFCHTLKRLDLSTNRLNGPPYWVWTEKPKNLTHINLSCNSNITNSFDKNYFEELLQNKTLVLEVELYNCGFRTKHTDFLSTFPSAKIINFGTTTKLLPWANILTEAPNKGLEQCVNIERLNLSNTQIYTVDSRIDKLRNLCELNLSTNNITTLPNEFCTLSNLETCILSENSILYLPDEMYKLEKLTRLYIDCNRLCMLPEKLSELQSLKVIDLYDNSLYEILEDYSHLEEFDVALNYMDEPEDIHYLGKKEKLRLQHENRCDGRKPEIIRPESESSSFEDDDEEYYRAFFNGEIPQETVQNNQSRASSPEDWDSDAHWIPQDNILPTKPTTSIQPWVLFIQRKMLEGNFCPIDAHVVSISEKVMYEKKLNPQVEVECEGQFDDYSSDES